MAKKPNRRRNFLEELENVPNVSLACKKTGLSRQTIYRWRKEDPGFKRRYDEALKSGMESVCDLAESKLIGHINAGNMRAIQYYLDNHKKEYMRPRPKDFWETIRADKQVTGIQIIRVDPEEVQNTKKRNLEEMKNSTKD